jgi:hypothetical protein
MPVTSCQHELRVRSSRSSTAGRQAGGSAMRCRPRCAQRSRVRLPSSRRVGGDERCGPAGCDGTWAQPDRSCGVVAAGGVAWLRCRYARRWRGQPASPRGHLRPAVTDEFRLFPAPRSRRWRLQGSRPSPFTEGWSWLPFVVEGSDQPRGHAGFSRFDQGSGVVAARGFPSPRKGRALGPADQAAFVSSLSF